MTEIDIKQALSLKNPLFIDVRAPIEYAEDHIPGAVNLPVLDDAEREEVGTIYHRVSQTEANLRGVEIILPKLPAMLRQIREWSPEHSVVIYCWRGGMRSKSLYQVAQMMKIRCFRLSKGYKDYRHYITDYFGTPFPYPVIVLHGLTGCGKTNILKKLAMFPNMQVLDLEGLAEHRGSAFGTVGQTTAQPSGKYFESLIWAQIDPYNTELSIITECESKRIGRLILPDNLFTAMKAGKHILIYDSVKSRGQRIYEEYRPEQHQQEIISSIQNLRRNLGTTRVTDLCRKTAAGEYLQVIEELLVDYYDPLYHYPDAPSAEYDLSVSSSDEDAAAQEIEKFVSDNFPARA
jgi:tRNA 2-selenouridine synthase